MTQESATEDLRYPVGTWQRPAGAVEASQRREWISQIADAPAQMRAAVAGLSEKQLDKPYRPGGWTVRQVVHHMADSHMNAFTRFKLGVTEEEPTIKTYEEQLWAELADSKSAIEPSLAILENLHARWLLTLRATPADAWARKVRHPQWGTMTLDELISQYAWHGRHHVAHITSLRERSGWTAKTQPSRKNRKEWALRKTTAKKSGRQAHRNR